MGKILVVDDSLVILDKTKNLLSKHNHQVDTAQSGSEGLEKIKRNNYDLVLLDVEMPDMDGFETCKQLREDERFNLLPIVIYYTDTEEIAAKVKGLETGASDFIIKSVAYKNPAEFIARIEAQLKIAQQIQQVIELERLRLLRQTAVTLANEINNPLNDIELSVKLMKDNNPKSCLYYEEITANIRKINTILRKLSNALDTATTDYNDEQVIDITRTLKKDNI